MDRGTLQKSGAAGLVSTLIDEEKIRFESVLSYTLVEVDVYKWKTFLNRLTIKKFDFVTIDAEGFDLSILQQMDLTDVKCLCIEFNGHDILKQRFTEIMQGFKIIYTSAENLLFAR